MVYEKKTSIFYDEEDVDQLLKQAYEECEIVCPMCRNCLEIDAEVCYCGWRNLLVSLGVV